MALVVGTDSYITLVEAEAYLANEINTTAWDALDDDTKENYLRVAYQYMQMLDMTVPDPTPTCVKNSQAIMANIDVNNGLSMSLGTTQGDISSVTADVVSVTYQDGTAKTASRYDPRVKTCLSSYGAMFSANKSPRLVRT